MVFLLKVYKHREGMRGKVSGKRLTLIDEGRKPECYAFWAILEETGKMMRKRVPTPN